MKHSPFWRALRRNKFWTLRQVRFLFAQAGVYTQPSFFIIGAQRGGTSVLFRTLCEHPDVVPGRSKEIRFFSRDKHYEGRGLNWYHSQFPLPFQLGEHGVTLDATPKYIYCPKCPKRIHKYNPRAKMILLLRDPVGRAYSAWNMFRNRHEAQRSPPLPAWSSMNASDREGMRRLLERKDYPSFEEAVREEIDNSLSGGAFPEPSFVRRGLYAEQIARYLKYFDREQIMIIDSRRLRGQTHRTMDDIAAFVGLRSHDWSQGETRRWRKAGAYETPISREAQAYLTEFYRPHNERLYELLGCNFGW